MQDVQDRYEHDAVEETSTNDGPLLEVLPGKELHRREPLLPNSEECEADDAKDDHADHARASPSQTAVDRKTEGEQEKRPTSRNQDDANNYVEEQKAVSGNSS